MRSVGAPRFAAPPSRPVATPEWQASGRGNVERVLIADDHPLVRDGLRTVISVAFDQADLFEASSVAEAAEIIAREGDFDLVLLDLNMPDAQGFSGLTLLRDRFPSLPIVMVSAAVEGKVVSAAIAHGAAGFIPKSLKRSQIVAAIQSILAGDIYIPADFAETSTTGGPELDDIRRRIQSLTPQQRVVLGLVVAGKLNKQIAFELDVSMTTVKAHVSAVLAKLNVYSRTQAVIMANKIGYGS